MRKFFLLFFCCLFVLAGCQSNSGYKVFVTNTKQVALLPLESFTGPDIDDLYYFELSFSDTSISCLSLITISSSEIFLSAFNEMGISMGDISYTDDDLQYSSTFLPENLRAEYIVADIQNIFFDYDVLCRHYGKKGLSVSEELTESGTVRNVYSGKKLIESIVYENDSISLKNCLRGYEYVLIKVD